MRQVLFWSSGPRRLLQLGLVTTEKEQREEGPESDGKEQVSKMWLVLLSTRSLAAVGQSGLEGGGRREEWLKGSGWRPEC